jgi:hypothetical protein
LRYINAPDPRNRKRANYVGTAGAEDFGVPSVELMLVHAGGNETIRNKDCEAGHNHVFSHFIKNL